MSTIPFGDAEAAMVASAAPPEMTIVRGMNGCAMASDPR
jgi:hypothetical protein